MNSPKVLKVQFNIARTGDLKEPARILSSNLDEGWTYTLAEMQVMGHPDKLVEFTHRIFTYVLGDFQAPWHFTSIEFIKPHADGRDDEWIAKIEADFKVSA